MQLASFFNSTSICYYLKVLLAFNFLYLSHILFLKQMMILACNTGSLWLIVLLNFSGMQAERKISFVLHEPENESEASMITLIFQVILQSVFSEMEDDTPSELHMKLVSLRSSFTAFFHCSKFCFIPLKDIFKPWWRKLGPLNMYQKKYSHNIVCKIFPYLPETFGHSNKQAGNVLLQKYAPNVYVPGIWRKLFLQNDYILIIQLCQQSVKSM